MKSLGWILAGVMLAFLVGTADYRYELERENEALKAKQALMIPTPNLAPPLRCGWRIAQRVDKRKRTGEIASSKWRQKSNCTEA